MNDLETRANRRYMIAKIGLACSIYAPAASLLLASVALLKLEMTENLLGVAVFFSIPVCWIAGLILSLVGTKDDNSRNLARTGTIISILSVGVILIALFLMAAAALNDMFT